MTEEKLVLRVQRLLSHSLKSPFVVHRGAALLYRITVDGELLVGVDPESPTRGRSAFQTDLCVFEKTATREIPRVVLEFKVGLSTHDILTYSAKAAKHKQIYPYLRYGVVVGSEPTIRTKFFVHNGSLDFCIALSQISHGSLENVMSRLVRAEVRASRQLLRTATGKLDANFFRTDIQLRRVR
jgi:hypothetical protein